MDLTKKDYDTLENLVKIKDFIMLKVKKKKIVHLHLLNVLIVTEMVILLTCVMLKIEIIKEKWFGCLKERILHQLLKQRKSFVIKVKNLHHSFSGYNNKVNHASYRPATHKMLLSTKIDYSVPIFVKENTNVPYTKWETHPKDPSY